MDIYPALRRLLFGLPAETSHDLALNSLSLGHRVHLTRLLNQTNPASFAQPVKTLGLEFPNPVGLSAGLDKNGDFIDALAALGFGFIEIGTITPRPQPGNPKPRMFRLPPEKAIINRMGFNNKGVDHLTAQVRQSDFYQNGGVLGINIGKNLTTPVEQAVDDYVLCLDKVYELASYLVVNISSPNTPGLRHLQYGEALTSLLSKLKEKQLALQQQHGRYVPMVLKIAPDIEPDEIAMIVEQLVSHEWDGIGATNTTSGRAGVEQNPLEKEAGGLSGAPLTHLSTKILQQVVSAVSGRLAVIGIGGIMSGADAAAKWESGADLIQLYSGFIYRGPELIAECLASYAVHQR